MSNNDYYVYAYIRTNTSKHGKRGTPYYIGKGRKGRAYNKDHTVPLPKDKSKIVFLEKNLTNIGACALERRLISWWGKISEGGTLRNITSGGDGNDSKRPWLSEYNRNRVHPFQDTTRPDHSKFMSEYNKKIWASLDDAEKNERKENIRNAIIKRNESFSESERKIIAEKAAIKNRGKVWWTNGEKTIKSKDSPGDGWFRGRKLNKTQ